MKTEEDVRNALIRYLRDPDVMLHELASTPHEDLVIFTMQLLNLSNMERELILRIEAQGNSHQQLSTMADDLLLSSPPVDGLCDVSGHGGHVDIGASAADDGGFPDGMFTADALRSSPQHSAPSSQLNSSDVGDDAEDPIQWKLNLLAQLQGGGARGGVSKGDAWGED